MRIIHKIIFRTCLLDTKHFTLSSHRPNYLSWASIITHDKIAYFNILDLLYRQIRHYYFLRGCFTSTTASDKDNEFLIMIMERIKRQGYAISIDDFGARYSNMALFINAQLDTLKLDRSMMQDLQNNRRSQMLISSLVQICHNLNMQLIVEGVETREQFDILKQLDCDGLQGYLIDRPIPIHDFEQKYIKTS